MAFDCQGTRYGAFTFIDWNGDVELCCSIRKDDAILPFSYLDTPLSVIQKERYNHYICKECVAHNLEWR